MPETLHDGFGLFTYFKQKSQKENLKSYLV